MATPKKPSSVELEEFKAAVTSAETARIMADRAKSKQKREQRDADERGKAYKAKLDKFYKELEQSERITGYDSPMSTFLDIQRLSMALFDVLLDTPKQMAIGYIKSKVEKWREPDVKFVPPVLYHSVQLDDANTFRINNSLTKLSSGASVNKDLQAKYDAVVIHWLNKNGYTVSEDNQNPSIRRFFSKQPDGTMVLLEKKDFEALRDGKMQGKIGLSAYFQNGLDMELKYEESRSQQQPRPGP